MIVDGGMLGALLQVIVTPGDCWWVLMSLLLCVCCWVVAIG